MHEAVHAHWTSSKGRLVPRRTAAYMAGAPRDFDGAPSTMLAMSG